MSLPARSNEIGSHVYYDGRTERQWGKYFGNDHVDEVIDFYPVAVQEDRKPWVTWSDHKRATTYSRSVRIATVDRPKISHRRITQGDPAELIVDMYSNRYVSREHGPFGYVPPNPGWQNAKDKSVTQALLKLQEHYAGLGADLAQGKKTIDLCAKYASQFGGALLAMKRGNIKQAMSIFVGLRGKRGVQSIPDTMSDLWLEFVYGVKPLMNDIYESQALVHQVLKAPLNIVGEAKASSEYVDSGHYSDRNYVGQSKASHRTKVFGTADNPLLYLLSSAGLANPLSVLWEVIPWSFAIDWFVPIGNTFQACTAGYGLSNGGGYTSSITNDQLDIHCDVTGLPPWGIGVETTDGGHYQEKGFYFSRQAYTSFPNPRLYANVTPYSTTRALNALALVQQLRR